MKLLAQYPDAVAVSLHDLEAEVLTTAAREIEFMALLDPDALGAVTLSGQDLLKRLSDLQAFAARWQVGQVRKTAPAVAPPPR